jgi:uncharacterized membrane protein
MSAKWVTAAPWAIVAGMFIAGLIAWPYAPESVPVHWSLGGEVNRYGSKWEGLLLLPVITLLVLIGLKLLPRIDPRRANYADFARTYSMVTLLVVAFLGVVYAIVLAVMFGAPLNLSRVVLPLLGVLLICLGAALQDVRPNWFVGIRTPWTLNSERSWTATHRIGRWVLIGMGVALVVAGLLETAWAVSLAIVLCIVGVVGLVAYSFAVWRDDPNRSSTGLT